MNFIKMVITLLIIAPLASSGANRVNIDGGYLRSGADLKNLLIETGNDPECITLFRADKIYGGECYYKETNVLQTLIRENYSDSFKLLFPHFKKGLTKTEALKVFRAAYHFHRAEIVDYCLSQDDGELNAVFHILWYKPGPRWNVDELVDLTLRHPDRIHDLVPFYFLDSFSSDDSVEYLFQLIENFHKISELVKDDQISPRNMLLRVVKNISLPDAELAMVFRRLIEIGADVTWETVYDFKANPDHENYEESYQLLIVSMADIKEVDIN